MNVTLYVWLLRPDNPGHVSLLVDNVYMSYWPTEAAGKKDVKIGQTHPAGFPKSYAADRRLEGKECDAHRLIPRLDTAVMVSAWNALRDNPTRYNLVDHNCSTVIAALLELGTGMKPLFAPSVRIDDHATGWSQRLFLRMRFLSTSIRMWTPDAVLTYADEIRARH